ncbi:MAG TPA: hypothetical protein PKE31_04060 [Pseudomonadota bacterium]|jgi:hypothetical protein|nr:hypothetical protein [Pseudomonadota bacterium]
MPDSIFLGTRGINLNTSWKQFATQALELCQLEILGGLTAAPGPDGRMVEGGPARSELAAVVQRRLASLKPTTKRGPRDFQRGASIRTDEIQRTKALALRYRVNLRADKTPLDQIDIPGTFAYLREEATNERRVLAMHDALFDVHMSVPAPVPTPPQHNNLMFRLHQVRCVDETNPEWWGSDEIAIGGVAISPNGTSAQISEYSVGGGFDDGDTKNYSPPRVLHTFPLSGLSYPAVFSVAVALAEKDSGGFGSFLSSLWNEVKKKVSQIIAAAVTAITGISGPIATIISNVVTTVLGWLVDWLIGLFGDDVFPVRTVSIRLESRTAHFGGSDASATYTLSTAAYGGSYRVSYSWSLS